MNGEELYKLHQAAGNELSCGSDDWEDLSALDRDIWTRTAELVEEAR